MLGTITLSYLISGSVFVMVHQRFQHKRSYFKTFERSDKAKLNFIEVVNSKLIEEYKGSTCCRPMMKLFEHTVIIDMRPKTNCIWDYRTDKCDPFK